MLVGAGFVASTGQDRTGHGVNSGLVIYTTPFLVQNAAKVVGVFVCPAGGTAHWADDGDYGCMCALGEAGLSVWLAPLTCHCVLQEALC